MRRTTSASAARHASRARLQAHRRRRARRVDLIPERLSDNGLPAVPRPWHRRQSSALESADGSAEAKPHRNQGSRAASRSSIARRRSENSVSASIEGALPASQRGAVRAAIGPAGKKPPEAGEGTSRDNAIEGDHRYVIVAEHGSDLVAQVSLSLGPSRVG